MLGTMSDEEEEEELEDEEEEEESSEEEYPAHGMAYEKPTVSNARMAGVSLGEKQLREAQEEEARAVDPGHQEPGAANSLRKLLRQRYGTCVQGWRQALDRRCTHFISRADFFLALRELGFSGSAKAAWVELGGCSSESGPGKMQVTLADLDAPAAELLSNFFREFQEEVGKLPELLAGCDGLRIGRSRFLERCEPLGKPRFESPAMDLDAVFKQLQTHGAVTEADVMWLQDYCIRAKRRASSDEAEARRIMREQRLEASAKATRVRAVDNFKTLLRHRFGSVMTGWRKAMDTEHKGEITAEELQNAADRLGFKGDVGGIWEELVTDDGYALGLVDLEPAVVQVVEVFKAQCVDRYGSLAKAFEGLEAVRKPLVTRDEFSRFCEELRFHGNKHLLFDYLDERHVGEILLTTIDAKTAQKAFPQAERKQAAQLHKTLEPRPAKPPRVTLQSRAAEQCGATRRLPEEEPSARQNLLAVLEQRFGSPVRAWGQVIDRKHKGKVKTDEFLVGCAAAGFTGSKTKLLQEMGLKDGSSVRLRDIAPEAVEECKEFKSQAGAKLAGIVTSLEASAPTSRANKGYKVEKKEFAGICKRLGYEGSVDRIFAHFDVTAEGGVNTRSLSALQEAKHEEKAMPILVKKHLEARQHRWQKKLAEQVVPPMQQLRTKQDTLLQAGREKRAAKRGEEEERKELLRALESKAGSVARAWRLAFDPDNQGEVDLQQFKDGLQNTGVLDLEGDEADAQKAARFFEAFCDEETGVVTLDCMDRRTPAALHEFLARCAARCGGVVQAFIDLDPEGTGVASREGFRHMCHAIKMTDNVRRLLEYLDPNEENEVPLELIHATAAEEAKQFVEHRKEVRKEQLRIDEEKGRMHMKKEPPAIGVPVGVTVRKQERDLEAGRRVLAELKRRLIREHGTLVRAWRKVLTPKGNGHKGRIGFAAFESACKAVGIEGDAQAAWQALEKKGKSLSLNEFDPGVATDFRELRARIAERYGSVEHAFEEVDSSASYELDFKGFLNLCYECQFRGNERRIFEYLDPEDSQRVPLAAIDRKAVETLKEKRKQLEGKVRSKGVDTADIGAATPATGSTSTALEGVARSFREHLARRFGSAMRAWRVLDREGRVALTKQEFVHAVPATGYSGNTSTLWAALCSEDQRLISLREVDPEVFNALATFRRRCKRKGGLQKAFQDATGEPTRRLSREEFLDLCRRVRCPRPWDVLFEQLDTRSSGSVTWEDVRFLEEHWKWNPVRPLRRAPGSGGSDELPWTPERSTGQGPLFTSLRPRKVTLKKATSLPALAAAPALRDNWNDRHHIRDTRDNKETQLLHLMTCVMTKDQDRIKRRVAQQMLEVPTHQWLQEHMLAEAEEEEDDYA